MQILMLFCLIPFLKTNAVLDHLPESIKVKKTTTTTTKNKQKNIHTQENTRKKLQEAVSNVKIKTIAVVKIGLSPSVKSFLLFASMIALQKS